MNKLLIITISTGIYKKFLPGFIQRACEYLYPKAEKVLHTITDLRESKLNKHMDNLPWPLVTLLRYHYIIDVVKAHPECSHVVYMDCDNKVEREINEYMMEDKIFAVAHFEWMFTPDYWYYLNEKLNKKSTSFMSNPKVYFNAGTFGGPIYKIIPALNELIDMINTDLKMKFIPETDDEAYWNKYCNTHFDEIEILPPEYNVEWSENGKDNVDYSKLKNPVKISTFIDPEFDVESQKLKGKPMEWL